MVGRHRKQGWVWIGPWVTAIVLTTLLVSSCGDKAPPEDKSAVVKPVKTLVLGASSSGTRHSFPGKVKASQQVDLAFEVAGRIIDLPVKKGQAVKKGELLARLDPADFENTLVKRKAQYENTQVNLRRAERLLAGGAVSQAEHDKRKTMFESAEADLKIAEKAVKDTHLKAPFSGLVAKKFVDNYQNVQAKENILSLQDVSHIEIVVNVPEGIMAVAKQGNVKQTLAAFEAIPGRSFQVKMKEFGTEADRQTQTFPVTLTMPAPEDVNILPGMTATITAELKTEDSAKTGQFAVPASAVFADEKGNPHVWVIDRDSMTPGKRAVKTGSLTGDNILVLEGLKPGEMIITAGVDFIRENMKVRTLDTRTGDRR